MPKQIKFEDVLNFEKVVIGGIVVAAICFVVLQFRNSTPKFSPTLVSDLNLQSPEETYSDFSTWHKQVNFDELFNFYLPSTLEIKTIEEGKSFRIISSKKPDSPLVSVEHLEYVDFQKEKQSLDKQGEQQYGWTNAYGASVFEYKKELVTVFVVDKEKKKVLKLVATEEKNFTLLENITKTFQSTAEETDIHGPWYVNFNGKYKIRYNSDLKLGVDEPFTNYADWSSVKLGKIQLSTYESGVLENDFYDLILKAEKNTEFPSASGEPVKILQDIMVDGTPAKLFEGGDESGTVGVVWKKGDTYFVLNGYWDSVQTLQTARNIFSNMLASFRFLTEQESMH